mmetsp:Transcript_11194/g.46638  ORF Transcript_11194/g.46638 Transcript_11194/m.46638 type:complete len:599 (-) Transcript_11194:138-1934(-)
MRWRLRFLSFFGPATCTSPSLASALSMSSSCTSRRRIANTSPPSPSASLPSLPSLPPARSNRPAPSPRSSSRSSPLSASLPSPLAPSAPSPSTPPVPPPASRSAALRKRDLGTEGMPRLKANFSKGYLVMSRSKTAGAPSCVTLLRYDPKALAAPSLSFASCATALATFPAALNALRPLWSGPSSGAAAPGCAWARLSFVPRMGTPRARRRSRKGGPSRGVRRSSAEPSRPAREVRPTRWMYWSTSSGQSICSTQSTAGKSRPRAATSVASSSIAGSLANFSTVAARRGCFMRPCRHCTLTPGRRRLSRSVMNCTCLQLVMNTTVLTCRCERTNDRSTSTFCSRLHVVYACLRLTGVGAAAASCTETYSGERRLRRARLLTDFVCVAEKSSVWRPRGMFSRMASSAAAKPMSRQRSASSSTSTSTRPVSNSGLSSMCCSRRPGVATTTLVLATAWRSMSTSLPPVSRAAVNVCWLATLRSSTNICLASSRVGESTSAPTPSWRVQRSRYRRSTTGIRNASDFPEPVLAAPSTSRPASASGSVAAWMAVSDSKPAAASADCVRSDSGRSANAPCPVMDALSPSPPRGAVADARRLATMS